MTFQPGDLIVNIYNNYNPSLYKDYQEFVTYYHSGLTPSNENGVYQVLRTDEFGLVLSQETWNEIKILKILVLSTQQIAFVINKNVRLGTT